MESEPKVTYAYEDDDDDDGGGNEEHEQEGHGAGDGAGADEEPSDLPVEPGPGAETEGPSVSLFPLANYSFGSTERGTKVRRRLHLRMIRHRQLYEKEGTRNTVAAVLLANVHHHPHVLLLRSKDPDTGSESFALPSARLLLGEDVAQGLSRCLAKRMTRGDAKAPVDWPIASFLGRFYRPEFDRHLYPYCPPHVSSPKEVISTYLMQLPLTCSFSCASKHEIVAIPLLDLYGASRRFGDMISMLPAWLSRCMFVYEDTVL